MDENLNSKLPENENENNYSFKEIFATFIRRPKLFLITTLLFFSGAIGYTIYERVKNPIFSGNFALMISDPIGSETVGKGNSRCV